MVGLLVSYFLSTDTLICKTKLIVPTLHICVMIEQIK